MARKMPTDVAIERDPHESALDEMHAALYTLGANARKPIKGDGANLLPATMNKGDKSKAKTAKKHIKNLHKAFKSLKKEK